MVLPKRTKKKKQEHNEACWGAQLQGLRADECPPIQDRSCRHFKTKFCEDCRWAMAVPMTRVRVLTRELAHMLENRRSFGMWTTAPERMGGFRFRIVNNTKECHPPRLVVFEKPPPKCVPWTTLDPTLVDDSGMVQLCVSKGTAVPLHHVKGRERVEFMMREPDSPGSSATSTASSPAPSRASSPEPPDPPDPPDVPDPPDPPDAPLPTLCEVIMPSVLMQLANTAVPSVESPSSSPATSPTSPPLSKTEARMQRNRESAATSRERKRKYVTYLEQQVGELERTVELLRNENWFWRSLEIDKYDPTCPLLVCEWF